MTKQDIKTNIPEWIGQLISTNGKYSDLSDGIKISNFSEVKMINKPWGFELWLADGSVTDYALKIIYLKKGSKTSLQYHKKKSEHNCVFSGTINFHYQDKESKKNRTVTLGAGNVIYISPLNVHRVEAVTDVLLVEASTNHLDDVVRIDDDYNRKNTSNP